MTKRHLIGVIAAIAIVAVAALAQSTSVSPQPSASRTDRFREAPSTVTQGALARFADSSGTLDDSKISDWGGRLTISNTAGCAALFSTTATGDDWISFGVDPTTGPVANIGYSGASLGRSTLFLNVRPDASATGRNPSLRFLTQDQARMIVDKDGLVGIGNVAPNTTLDVTGTGHFSGAVTIDGTLTAPNFAAKYQDLAEWVPAGRSIEAGTVVVLDRDRANHVVPSAEAYDTAVAGVVSSKPAIILGTPGKSKVTVATTGRVKVRAEATHGPIAIGDLLVTSDTAGVAMKSEAVVVGGVKMQRPGTLIGKALEPLPSGSGEILVLLSLQ